MFKVYTGRDLNNPVEMGVFELYRKHHRYLDDKLLTQKHLKEVRISDSESGQIYIARKV